MKKAISIKTQKALMFIPLFNLFNLGIWVINCRRLRWKRKIVYKYSLALFGIAIIWGILGIILSCVFGDGIALNIYGYVASYFYPLSLSYGIIKFQEKMNIESQL